EVDLGDGAQPIGFRNRQQQTKLHAVASEEGHAFQHSPAPRVLARQRLDEAGQLGKEQIEQRPGRELRDASATLGLQFRAELQRSAVEALDVVDLGVAQQGTEQAVNELGVDIADIGVDPADQVAQIGRAHV